MKKINHYINNTRPHTSATTSVVDLAPSDIWLFVSFKDYLKEIYFTRDDEVHATIGKWFQERDYVEKLRTETRVHFLSYTILCCILMPCLTVKIQPQLSKYPSYVEEMLYYYILFIFLIIIRSHSLQMLLFLKTQVQYYYNCAIMYYITF
jgi:hypothetical protein